MNRFLAFLFLLLSASLFAQQKAYYRMPAVYNNWIVFTAEGDLWRFDLTTNQSTRLTSHQGVESEPAFSPDGKSIVFTGEYDGAPELYQISAEGGVPKRITYENMRGIKAIRWVGPEKILYTTRSQSSLDDNQLAYANPNTLVTEMIPLAQAADGDIDTNGILFFTRFPFQ